MSAHSELQGLAFSQARQKLCDAVLSVLAAEYHNQKPLRFIDEIKRPKARTVAGAVSIVLLVIAAIFEEHKQVGLIVAASLLLLCDLTSSACRVLYIRNEKIEYIREVFTALASYVDLSNRPSFASAAKPGVLQQGHTHASVVITYRNHSWHRLPSLLLVEGDIIAMMAGDLVPTGCVELHIDKHEVRLGRPYYKDSKVGVRPLHRLTVASKSTIPAISKKLLQLNGDLRCFKVMETPIVAYLEDNLRNPSYEPADSLIRKYYKLVASYAPWLLLGFVLLYFVTAIVRLVAEENSRDHWAEVLFLPPVSMAICFIPPCAVPFLILLEAFGTARLMTCIESLLITASRQGRAPGSPPLSPGWSSSPPQRQRFWDFSWLRRRPAAAPAAATTSGAAAVGATTRATGARDVASQEAAALGSPFDDEDDEAVRFIDVDVDDRQTLLNPTVNRYTSLGRHLRYTFKILHMRLWAWQMDLSQFMPLAEEAVPGAGAEQNGSGNDSSVEIEVDAEDIIHPGRLSEDLALDAPLLIPPPLARMRTLETFGAITSMSFIDDDVICEPYSVAEEIFLLESSDEGVSRVVLDLHANPNATGTRFEDPNWWAYLRSLKPIGLTSLLTHSWNGEDSSNGESPESDVQPASDNVFSSLLKLVRTTTPLEFLRDLSEEIGFTEEDARVFTKKMELHLLAPQLGDIRLMEDMHAWGQEETRRRGSLQPHVRSVIVKDERANALQMLTQGHPSLLLEYCLDFWDGQSISPLKIDDRKAILDMYQQWTLEDFDVVAFAYTPVPYFHADLFQHKSKLPTILVDNTTTAQVVASQEAIRKQAETLSGVTPGDVAATTGAGVEDVAESKRSEQQPEDDETKEAHVGEQELHTLGEYPPDAQPQAPELVLHFPDESRPQSGEIFSVSLPPVDEHVPELSEEPRQRTLTIENIGLDIDGSDAVESERSPEEKVPEGAEPEPKQFTTTAMPRINSDLRSESVATLQSDNDKRDSKSAMDKEFGELMPSHPSLADTYSTPSFEELELVRSRSEPQFATLADGAARMHSPKSTVVLAQLEQIPEPHSAVDVTRAPQMSVASNFRRAATVDPPRNGDKHAHHHKYSKLGNAMWGLMKQQVFLGMAASSVPVKPGVPNMVEDLMASGVRFVYYSPRNMRRSKALAEKLGLEIDWNCAISLRALDDASQPDPYRIITSYADWDVKARMPHGPEQIRTHLIEVDNVPLLVSLFTDATHDTIEEMVQIAQEYHETVAVIGASYRANNSPIFAHADLAVQVDMLPGDMHLTDFPLAAYDRLSAADLLFNADIVGMRCQKPLGTFRSQIVAAQSGHLPAASAHSGNPIDMIVAQTLNSSGGAPPEDNVRLGTLIESVREGRVLLHTAYQMLGLACVSVVTAGALVAFIAFVPTALPLLPPTMFMILLVAIYLPLVLLSMTLSPAEPGVMKATPHKNQLVLRDQGKFWSSLFLRSIPVALACVACVWWGLDVLLDEDNPKAIQRDPRNTDMSLYYDTLDDGKYVPHALAVVRQVEDLAFLQLLLCLLVQSASLLYRALPLHRYPRLFWSPWFVTICAVLAVQVAITLGRSAERDTLLLLGALPWYYWVASYVIVPLLALGLQELLKCREAPDYLRYRNYLRLQFDTRLGMHSPR